MKGSHSTYKPSVGERVLISPPNSDDENGFVFQEYNILWANEKFVLYGNDNCWPNLNKWEHVCVKPIVCHCGPDQGGPCSFCMERKYGL
jgi:hypothetical protein